MICGLWSMPGKTSPKPSGQASWRWCERPSDRPHQRPPEALSHAAGRHKSAESRFSLQRITGPVTRWLMPSVEAPDPNCVSPPPPRVLRRSGRNCRLGLAFRVGDVAWHQRIASIGIIRNAERQAQPRLEDFLIPRAEESLPCSGVRARTTSLQIAPPRSSGRMVQLRSVREVANCWRWRDRCARLMAAFHFSIRPWHARLGWKCSCGWCTVSSVRGLSRIGPTRRASSRRLRNNYVRRRHQRYQFSLGFA